jgi:phytoene dehydrogenase-like protein
MPESADAVVIGSGPNGLVAACRLADAGWDVVLLEASDHFGGAVWSAELTPGYTADLASSFYPLAAASPTIQALELDRHGLQWSHAPAVLAHPLRDDEASCAVMHRSAEDTAALLDADAPGDGDAWLTLVAQWQRLREPVLRALFTPFPPVGGMARLAAAMGTAPDAIRLARTLLLPVTQLGEELFRGRLGRLLLAGNAMHADIPAVSPGSGGFGWLLCMLGQDVGFPVPVGGAGALADAIAARARAAGAQLHTGSRVERVVVGGGRALGVVTADGRRIRARRAVLADVSATSLYRELLAPGDVPARVHEDLARFTWDLPTVKLNWALDGPIPWRASAAGQAGTVHLGADDRELAEWSAALTVGRPTAVTFLLLGQMALSDPTRAPAGAESVWAYSHLPRGVPAAGAAIELAAAMEAAVEAHAPGFRDRIVHRMVQGPAELQAMDANLVAGSTNGGTAQLFQQLVFRPVPGLGRPETPVLGLYLASAGAHPGGGVHGGPGDIAARAALRSARLGGVPGRVLTAVARHLAGGHDTTAPAPAEAPTAAAAALPNP